MQFVRPFTYHVAAPHGGRNLLYGSLMLGGALLVPVVPQMALLGYRAEVGDALDRDPDLADHPDFDFDRFVPYLIRGAWPFLMQLVVAAVVAGLLLAALAVGGLLLALLSDPTVGLVTGGVLLIPGLLAGPLLLWPLELHAGLSRSFRPVAAFRFAGRFLRLVGGQLLLAMTVFGLVTVPLAFGGLLVFGVGLLPALVVSFMAQQHYMNQLYRVYLGEGGEAITPAERQGERPA